MAEEETKPTPTSVETLTIPVDVTVTSPATFMAYADSKKGATMVSACTHNTHTCDV